MPDLSAICLVIIAMLAAAITSRVISAGAKELDRLSRNSDK